MNGQALNIHLLVIDDDDVDRERVLRLLSHTPLSVAAMQADSGPSALRLLREHVFDCIVLDHQLGPDSGTDLLPAIQRASRRPCPVIMITGAGSESLAVHALQQGAADYLTKYQLDADMLARAIRRALDHQRLHDELDELQQSLERRVEVQAAAIRQSERDLRATLDHTPTVIGYWHADLRARFGNRAFRRWLGVDPDTLPGRAMQDVIGPARLARVQSHIDGVLQGESQSFELSDLAPDGTTRRHSQISFHPDLDDDGQVRGFYSTLNDVTEIKQAQAQAEELAAFAEALFEHSPVGLAVFDEQLCFLRCNRELDRLLGTVPRGLLGVPLEALSGDDLVHFEAMARATLADGLPRHLDVDVVTVFGMRLQAACAWARVERDRRGQLLLAVQDSTEQRRSHDALVEARNAAESATRSKSAFLANMSHEIRTPMNAILGLTRLALDDGLIGQTRDFVGKAHGAAQALMGLLDDILDYSKIEAGQLRLERVPLSIERVLQRVVDLFAARVEQKGLRLSVDVVPGVPRWVHGDPLRLEQVLNNLLGNAVKFTEAGSIALTVQGHDAAGPGLLRFTVRDTGIGIAADQREALFEAFSQADTSITRRYGGTGLGLSICRRLVLQMHGTIGVDSVPGKGSAFWFTARLDPAPAAPADGPDADADDSTLKVLLVEPDAAIGTALQHSLQWQGIEAQHVADGAAADIALARAAAEAWPFDGVLLDWEAEGSGALPVDARSALVRRLRQAAGPPPPPAVIGLVSVVRRANANGPATEMAPDLQLSKPVLPQTVRRALLQLRRARADRASDIPPDIPARPAPAPASLPLAGLRILLVEDNPINQEVAQITLERLGASVVVCADGLEALARLHGGPPTDFDVVLMDMQMPHLDGLETTRRLRGDPRSSRLPVVGMTAAAMPEDRLLCLQAGMVDYVTKPFVVERLLDALLRCTGRRVGASPGETGGAFELPGFDLGPVTSVMRGRSEAVLGLLRSFAAQEETTMEALGADLARQDLRAIGRRLHALRGGAETLGALAVTQAAKQAEQALRHGLPLDGPLLALGDAMQAALAAIRARLPEAGRPGDPH